MLGEGVFERCRLTLSFSKKSGKFVTNEFRGLFGHVMSTILRCSAHDVLSHLLHTLEHRGSQAEFCPVGKDRHFQPLRRKDFVVGDVLRDRPIIG